MASVYSPDALATQLRGVDAAGFRRAMRELVSAAADDAVAELAHSGDGCRVQVECVQADALFRLAWTSAFAAYISARCGGGGGRVARETAAAFLVMRDVAVDAMTTAVRDAAREETRAAEDGVRAARRV